jgi:hypothetical protein
VERRREGELVVVKAYHLCPFRKTGTTIKAHKAVLASNSKL